MKIGLLDKHHNGNYNSSIEPLNESSIFDTLPNNLNAVVINIDDFEDKSFCGLLALYHLRLIKKISLPIICYSFHSIEYLCGLNPVYIILFAKGNAFIQLPFSLSELQKKITQIDNARIDFVIDYPKYVTAAINDQILKHHDANLFALNKTARTWYNYKGTSKPDWFKKEFTNYGKFDFGYIASSFLFTNDLKYSQDEIEIINQNLKREIETLSTLNDKEIIYIDDMSDQGWGNLLKSILSPVRLTIINQIQDVDAVFNKIQSSITFTVSPNKIILLDLRLLNEKGNINVKELSGFKLFKKIKVFNPSIPIIIVSATSNKDTINYLLKCGAHAVWNKEGVNNNLSDIDYRNKISRLINNVFTAFTFYKNDADRYIKQVDYFLRIIDNSDSKFNCLPNLDKIDLSQFDEVVLDTNTFIDFNYIGLLNAYLFIELCIINKKKIVFVNDVYYELLKFSMWDNVSQTAKDEAKNKKINDKSIWSSKYAIQYINKLLKEYKVFAISKPGRNKPIEDGLYPYQSSIYADPKIIEYCNSSSNKIILLVKDANLKDNIKNSNVTTIDLSRDYNYFWDYKVLKNHFADLDW